VDGERHAVRDAVRDADELDLQGPDAHAVARAHRVQPRALFQTVLLELRLDQRKRQRRAVDRAIDVRQDVRHGADVILVAVRQHQCRGAPLLLQVREIRDDQVHAQQLGIGEHHARIDDDRRPAPGEREHVHPELAESAERNDFEHDVGHICRPTPATFLAERR
jgi:hypothetical protein